MPTTRGFFDFSPLAQWLVTQWSWFKALDTNDRLSLICVALALIALLQMLIFILQSLQVRKTLKTYMRGERPYVYVAPNPAIFPIKPEDAMYADKHNDNDNERPSFTAAEYTLVNNGRTQAVVREVHAVMLLEPMLPRRFNARMATHVYSETPLSAGGSTPSASVPLMKKLGSEDVAKIKSGHQHLFFCGHIKYSDVFGYMRTKGFCFRYNTNGMVSIVGGRRLNYEKKRRA